MVSLPSGTVTFLFTDIEGSTRLMEQLGDAYGEVLNDHRRLLREQFTQAGGQEIDTQGDAFFFSFTRARDAIAGAVSAQRALTEHEWPHGAAVRVRMGLHTGEPAVGEEGYHGLDVVRASRICSAARGGQILVSETTQALAGSALPDGVRVRDLGEQPLKDMKSERVFQLLLEGSQADAPALRDLGAVARAKGRTRADALAARWEGRLDERIEQLVQSQLERAFGGQPTAGEQRASRRVRAHGVTATLSGLVLVAALTIVALGAAVVALVFLIKFAF